MNECQKKGCRNLITKCNDCGKEVNRMTFKEPSEWISIEEKLPPYSGIAKVRRQNGSEIKAYFHADQMKWLSNYYKGPLSHFQDRETLDFLFDVTHWMPPTEPPKEPE